MTVVAGLDVGNATTELVLVERGGSGRLLAWDAVPSGGVKGSPASLRRAAALLERLERRVGERVGLVAVAPWRPVRTATAALPEPPAPAGRLAVLAAGARTVAGAGFGVGRPVPLELLEGADGPLVAVAGPHTGHAEVVGALEAALAAGRTVVAVLLARDEAVLVANRLEASLPVYDGIDPVRALACERIAVECRAPGHRLHALNDTLALVAAFGRDAGRAGAVEVARELDDVSAAVVALGAPAPAAEAGVRAWVELLADMGLRRVGLDEALEALALSPPGLARMLALPGRDGVVVEYEIDDLALVDLARTADEALARRAAVRSRAFAYAALARPSGDGDGPALLAEETGRPVAVVGAEPVAARVAALTTPGAGEAAVLDLGGGSLDAVDAEGHVVVAGCGDLLTVATAAILGLSPAVAEWAKRGPSFRVESPQLLAGEDGARVPYPRPLDGGLVGRLVVHGPVGFLPVSDRLGPGEWRTLRRRLQEEVVGRSARRALAALGRDPAEVVVVGGPAGDDEVLAVLARVLAKGTRIGRGNVAGTLGHRYAVAYGLARLAD